MVGKCKEKVLPDVLHRGATQRPRRRDAAQVALHQGHRGALHGHVRTGPHRDAYLRLRQCRGVVHPVTCHGDDVAVSLEFFYHSHFLIGQHIGNYPLQSQSLSDRVRRFFIIARQHDDRYLLVMKLPDRIVSGCFDRVCDANDTGDRIIDDHKHSGFSLRPTLISAPRQVAWVKAAIAQQCGVANCGQVSVNGTQDTFTGEGLKILDARQLDTLFFSIGDNSLGQGMFAAPPKAGSESKHGRFFPPVRAQHGCHFRFADG